MADIKLDVCIDVMPSYRQFRRQLNAMVKRINDKPYKIKVELEQKSIDTLNQKLDELNTKLKNFGSGGSGGGSGGAGNQAKKSLKELYNLHRQMTDIIHKNKNAEMFSGTEKSFEQLVFDAELLRDTLDKVENGAIDVNKAFQLLNNINFFKDARTNMSKLGDEMSIFGASGNIKTSEITSLATKIRSTLNANSNAKGLKVYSDLEDYLNKINIALDDIRINTVPAEEALERVGIVGRAGFEKAKLAVLEFNDVISRTGNKGSVTGTQLNNQISAMRNLLDGNDYLSNTQAYSDVNEIMQKFLTAVNEAQTGTVSLEQALRNVGINGANAIEMAKDAVSRFKVEISGTQPQKILTLNSSDQLEAIIKVRELQNQLKANKENWSAAKHTSDYKDYANQNSELDKLLTQLRSGTMKAEDFANSYAKIYRTMNQSELAIRANDKAHKSLSDRLLGNIGKFGQWFSATQTIMTAVRYFKEMIQKVIELDTAMTELKKVTEATDEAYEKFLVKATDRAKKLGSTVTDIVGASSTFARLGFDLGESEQLADAAIVYKNVGDGIENIDQASESIIATMQAYGIEAKNVMSIIDKFNEVGNNYAISSSGVGDALLRSAAAMKAAGNTIDETIALATAANTVVQDPEKVGTTLKTLSMYLRASKTDAEEAGESTDGMAGSVSELRKEILALTGNKVDIQIDENTYKSSYQILKELSEVWHELTDVSKANILEMVGGKRNANIVAALLENFKIAEESLDTSLNSAGSALEENEKVLESIQGRINILKASFETLANTLIEGDLLKGIVFIGTKLLDAINLVVTLTDKIGGLKTVLASVVSILAVSKAETIFKIFEGDGKDKKGLIRTLQGVKTNIVAIAKGAKDFVETFIFAKASDLSFIESLSAGLRGVGDAAVAAQLKMIAIIAAIAAVAAVVIAIEKAVVSTAEASETATEKVKELEDATEDLTNSEKELRAISERIKELESKGTITLTEQAELDTLRLEREELERHVALLEAKAAAAEKAAQAAKDEVWNEYKSGSLFDGNSEKSVNTKLAELDSYRDSLIKRQEQLIEAYNNGGVTKDGYWDTEELEKDIFFIEEKISTLETDLWGVVDLLGTGNEEAQDAAKSLAYYLSSPTEQLKLLRSEIDEIPSSLEAVAESAYKSIDKEGYGGVIEDVDEFAQKVKDAYKESSVFKDVTKDMSNEELVDWFVRLCGEAENTESAISGAAESLTTFQSYASNINSVSEGLESLLEIYNDVKDGKDFDFSALFDDDFKSKFSGYTEEYENLIKVISSSPKDIKACQSAFDELATAYIIDKANLEDVTEETKDLTIAMLKQEGVANAELIVEQQLVLNTARRKAEIELESRAKKANTEVTYELIASMAKEEKQGSLTSQALLDLALSKFNVNNEKINSDDDVEHIIAIARASGIATKAISKLIQAKGMFDRASLMYAQEGDSRHYQNLYTQATRLANEAMEELTADDYKANTKAKFNGNAGNGGSSNPELDAWNKLVAEKKHLLEMDKITEEEYYSWLASAYKKHISNSEDHKDEIMAIEEELYNWNKEKVQKNIDAELAVLDYERAKGLISEETYFAKRKELYENGYAELQNLVDEQGLYGVDSAERLKAETEFIESVKEAHISSFEAERSALEHKLAMNLISEEQYLAELERLYNEYYKDRAEYAEEAEEIEEELYDKRVELVEKWANAASDAIQEVADATENMVDALANFVEGAIDTNEENFNLEKSLLDHALSMNYISEEEYYSELEKLYQSYFKDKHAYMEQYWENQEEVYAYEQQMLEDSASAVEDIHSKVVEMIKKELEDAKEAIEKTKEEYLDLINIRREALSDLKDEDDYEKERNEKLSTISELQRQLNALSYDTSAAGVRKYKEVYAQLQEAQEELAEFEKERAYQIMNDQLDAEEEGIEKAFDAQTGKYDELLEDNVYLVEEAWKRMDGMSETLYQQLEAYNAKYSTSIKDDITDAWKTATAGLEEYKHALDGYKDITGKIGDTGMEQPEYDLFNKYVKEKQAANWVSTSVELGTSLVKTGADLVAGFADILAGLSDNPIFQLLSIGASSMSSLAGAGAGIISSLTGLLGGLASGSDYVPRTGWYQTDEEGEELKLVKDSHGNQYRLLTEGSKVLNAGAVSRLMSLVNNPNLIAGLTKGASLGVSSGEIKANIDTSSRSVVLNPVFQITSSDPKGVANEIKKLLPTIADYTLGALVNGAGNMGIKRNAKALC